MNNILNKFICITILFIIFFSPLTAQNDSAFKSEGKMIIQVIGRALYENQNSEDKAGMYINRAYIGYGYQFTPQWSGTVVFDVGRPTIFGNLAVKDSSGNNMNPSYSYQQGSYYTMSLKFAFIEFRPFKDLKLQAGSILQNNYNTQERFWGYRYVSEIFQDRHFSLPSTDLGFIGYYNISKWLACDFAVTNGEGYRNNQDSYGKIKIAGGIDLKPLDGLIFRIFMDNEPSDNATANATQQMYSGFIGYKYPQLFRIAAEYNYRKNHNHLNDNNIYGFSVFGSYVISDNLELFARYDNLRSNTITGAVHSWNYKNDGDLIMGGVHFSPFKGISLSLSYQGWNPTENEFKYKNTAAFCFEYKL